VVGGDALQPRVHSSSIKACGIGFVAEAVVAQGGSPAIADVGSREGDVGYPNSQQDEVINASSQKRSVPRCGWADLGTPQRLGIALQRLRADDAIPRSHTMAFHLNLSDQYARYNQVTATT
jgi:mannose-1-phosphate guanylyltransferase